jgi:hypothetical protein
MSTSLATFAAKIGNQLVSVIRNNFARHVGAGMAKERLSVQQGHILWDGTSLRCKVRHLTATSATVQTWDAPALPAAFALRVPNADLDARCQVIWRDERRLGVTFV